MRHAMITSLAAFALAAGAALGQGAKPAQPDKPAGTGVGQPASARPFALMVGDKAPELTIEKWVKGDSVAQFEKGKVYVVEFWATWCGPCIASMPHLSELQKKYRDKGLTIIGVTSADPRNTLEKVEAMVKDKGDTMGYTVAWDTERKTNEAFMRAAGRNGIPCSFLVNGDGKIAYIGHPMGLDQTLDEVVKGTHDLKAAADKYALAARAEGIQNEFLKAFGTKDWPAAEAAYEKLAKADAKRADAMAGSYFHVLLIGQKNYAKASEFGNRAVEGSAKDNAMALNTLAWTIVDPDLKVEKKDLDLALKAATRSNELSQGKSPEVLDTLARVYFCRGEVSKAIELQTKAVELAKGELKDELAKVLKEYKDKSN